MKKIKLTFELTCHEVVEVYVFNGRDTCSGFETLTITNKNTLQKNKKQKKLSDFPMEVPSAKSKWPCPFNSSKLNFQACTKYPTLVSMYRHARDTVTVPRLPFWWAVGLRVNTASPKMPTKRARQRLFWWPRQVNWVNTYLHFGTEWIEAIWSASAYTTVIAFLLSVN